MRLMSFYLTTEQRVDALLTDPAWGRREVTREGFPAMPAFEFVEFFCRTHQCEQSTEVTRIEFDYVADHGFSATAGVIGK